MNTRCLAAFLLLCMQLTFRFSVAPCCLAHTMDADRAVDTSIDEVDALMSNLQSRLAQQIAQHSTPTTATSADNTPLNLYAEDSAKMVENTSIPLGEQNGPSSPLMPAFLADHNVAATIGRANALYTQRVGQPAVLSVRFDPTFLHGGIPDFGGAPERLNSLDFHPSLGPSGYESSSSAEPRDLPSKFLTGQETASVQQITKRPKLRAKNVAHHQSLTSGEFPSATSRFWDLDSSLVRTGHVELPHTPLAVPTPTAAEHD